MSLKRVWHLVSSTPSPLRSVWHPIAEPSLIHRKAGDGFESVTESPYYWQLYRSPLPPGDVRDPDQKLPKILTFETETEVLGQRLTVTKKQGYPFKRCAEPTTIVRDSLDGRRDECRNRHGLLFVTDGAPLAGIEWNDKTGMPLRVHIGIDLVLEYSYPDGPGDPDNAMAPYRWTRKQLRTKAGKVLGTWTPQDPPEPRPGARLWGSTPPGVLGLQPIIAEWDQELYPEGVAAIPDQYGPYALLPLGESGEVWRSVSLAPLVTVGDDWGAMSFDRLDYTDTDSRIWLYLAGPANTVHSVMVEHPRTVTP